VGAVGSCLLTKRWPRPPTARADAITIFDAGWMEDMNPGFTVTAKMPFDVPPGTQVDRIELHDSAFSAGVGVKLT
jgi:hypothetical protein